MEEKKQENSVSGLTAILKKYNLTEEPVEGENFLLNELRKKERINGKKLTYERFGKLINYGKSQTENFLKGKSEIDEETKKTMIRVLNAEEEISDMRVRKKRELLIKELNPELTEEEVEREADLQEQEWIGWQQEEAVWLEEIEKEFMELEYSWCYRLDTYAEAYIKAKIPENYYQILDLLLLNQEEVIDVILETLEDHSFPMRQATSPYFTEQVRRFWDIAEIKISKKEIAEDLKQVGNEKPYTTAEYTEIRRKEHWESFKQKIENHIDYFHQSIKYLPRINNGLIWQILIELLALDNFSEKRGEKGLHKLLNAVATWE